MVVNYASPRICVSAPVPSSAMNIDTMRAHVRASWFMMECGVGARTARTNTARAEGAPGALLATCRHMVPIDQSVWRLAGSRSRRAPAKCSTKLMLSRCPWAPRAKRRLVKWAQSMWRLKSHQRPPGSFNSNRERATFNICTQKSTSVRAIREPIEPSLSAERQ